ncbi:MAG: hypothetical protein NCW75_14025 [Phycisphaera sp.]|nr:MAG: hypothetical protein NCW75_14025 [Phycisphaera sp.]
MKVTDLGNRYREESDVQRGVLVAIVVVIAGLAIGALSMGSSVFREGTSSGLSGPNRISELPAVLSGPDLLKGTERTRAAVSLRMKVRSLERHQRELTAQGISVDGLDELIEYSSLVADSIKPREERP